MSWLFRLLGVLSFVAGCYVGDRVVSDIQIQIVATLLVGGVVMFGIGLVMAQLKSIARAVTPDASTAPKRDPYA